MKKTILLVSMVFGLGMTAIASSSALQELNARILEILTPYNNQTTTAQLVFSDIETNSERALKLALSGVLRKVGSVHTVALTVNHLSYDYGTGAAPTTQFNGGLEVDLTKFLPQSELNDLIPETEKWIEHYAKNLLAEYGESATIKTQITDKQQNANGDYVAISGHINFEIDLNKLPSNKKLQNVEFLSAQVSFHLNLNQGISLDLTVISNPRSQYFQHDQDGLKEYLEKLLSNDAAMNESISSSAKALDAFLTDLTNKTFQ